MRNEEYKKKGGGMDSEGKREVGYRVRNELARDDGRVCDAE